MVEKKNNPRILMVAFHYPPVCGSSGVQRSLTFSKYLFDHGWEPMILTISPSAYDKVNDNQMSEIPKGMIVERAFGLNAARHLSIAGRYLRCLALPDRWVSWAPVAVWRGMVMIRELKPRVILSTYPIASAHLIGLLLARLSGLPLVADFRDPMLKPNSPKDPLTIWVLRRLEAMIVRHCARAVFTTAGSRAMYAERYPAIPSSRWFTIENGFDEENFHDAENGLVRDSMKQPRAITLIHSGVLYSQTRDPSLFFSALQKLVQQGDVTPQSLQIILRATGFDNEYQAMIAKFGLSDIVKLAPMVDYRTALREMLSADGLLLFQGSFGNYQIPAKLYEYFRAGRPIFALIDPIGDTAQALRLAAVNNMVDIANEQDITRGLRNFLHELRDGHACGVDRKTAASYSRQSRTAELAKLLGEVLAEHRVRINKRRFCQGESRT